MINGDDVCEMKVLCFDENDTYCLQSNVPHRDVKVIYSTLLHIQ